MEAVIRKYSNKPLKFGELDCHTLILDYLGCDTTQILGTYSSYKEGLKVLPKITGFNNPMEFLESKGFVKINPLLVSDGCIVVCDKYALTIYHSGYLFGIWENTFKLRKVSPSYLKDLGVFRNG